MYVVQRYLDPDALIRAGLTDFDSWAATFGEVLPGPELAVAGGGRFKVKIRPFHQRARAAGHVPLLRRRANRRRP